jgi:hypothetical protein
LIETVEQCPSCHAEVEQVGETEWDDRGPFQLISIRRYVCECGLQWTHETDGS